MIDTHCHIFCEYYSDISKVISDLSLNCVDKIIICGCDRKSNMEVLETIIKYDNVYGAIGFHPTELNDINESDLIWLEEHINDKKIVGIGEIGLDYHYDNTDKVKQSFYFEKQIELSNKYNKPIIIHSRDSINDTYNILNMYSGIKGVLHAYNGSIDMAKKFINMGLFLGIGGVVTFKNAVNIVEVIKSVGISHLLLETDSPYLTPEPYRGKTNNPIYIKYVAEKIANILNISIFEVENITTVNASSLFDFYYK